MRGHPIKRIVGGMVDAIIAAESHIDGSNAQVLKKRRVIRTRTKRANTGFGDWRVRACCSAGYVRLVAFFTCTILPLLINRFSVRMFDVSRCSTDQPPHRWHQRPPEFWPGSPRVHVDVCKA